MGVDGAKNATRFSHAFPFSHTWLDLTEACSVLFVSFSFFPGVNMFFFCVRRVDERGRRSLPCRHWLGRRLACRGLRSRCLRLNGGAVGRTECRRDKSGRGARGLSTSSSSLLRVKLERGLTGECWRGVARQGRARELPRDAYPQWTLAPRPMPQASVQGTQQGDWGGGGSQACPNGQ